MHFTYFLFADCTGSLLQHVGFLELLHVGVTLCCGRASLGVEQGLRLTGSRASVGTARGLRSCRAGGLVALRHVKSSLTRDQTCLPCIDRQILIYCTTREVLKNCV